MRTLEHLPYRQASAALILLFLVLTIGVVQLGGPGWLGGLLGLPVYLFLVVLTYRRLKELGHAGGWIVLMVMALNFGPKWEGPEPVVFYLSHLLHLVPVAIGWLPNRQKQQQASV